MFDRALQSANCKPEFLAQHKLTGKIKAVAKYVKKADQSVLAAVYEQLLEEPSALIGEREPSPL